MINHEITNEVRKFGKSGIEDGICGQTAVAVGDTEATTRGLSIAGFQLTGVPVLSQGLQEGFPVF